MTHSPTLTSRARRSLLVLAVFAGSGLAQAQSTDAPLRLIVPFTPGTGIDLIARTIGPKLSERLKRPVVVDNRAGASGNITRNESPCVPRSTPPWLEKASRRIALC